eukprot:9116078-Pyramimonas_sp.AAC.1
MGALGSTGNVEHLEAPVSAWERLEHLEAPGSAWERSQAPGALGSAWERCERLKWNSYCKTQFCDSGALSKSTLVGVWRHDQKIICLQGITRVFVRGRAFVV